MIKGKKSIALSIAVLLMVSSNIAFADNKVKDVVSSNNIRVEARANPQQIKLAGSDRYKTAVEISKAGWSSSDRALLVNGTALPDALCASPLADEYNAPILLTEREQVNSGTLAELKRLGVKNITLIGSEGVITKVQEDQLKREGFTVERIGGVDRYDTSLKIANKLNGLYSNKGITKKPIFIANGVKGLADATSVSSPAGIKDGVILYTNGTNLNGVKSYIEANANQVYIIGSEGVVTKAVEDELKRTGIPVKRIGGVDRKDTNAKVVNEFFGDKTKETAMYVAKDGMGAENQLVDGLAVGSLASKNKAPVMLASDNLGESQKSTLKDRKVSTLVQVGDGRNANPTKQAMGIITANAVPEGGGGTTSPDGMKLPTIQYAPEKSMKMSGYGGYNSPGWNRIEGTINVKYGNPNTVPHSYGSRNQAQYDSVVNYVKDKVKGINYRLKSDWVYTQHFINNGNQHLNDEFIDPVLLANNITVAYGDWRVNNKYIVIGLQKGIVSREDAEKLAIYNSAVGTVKSSIGRVIDPGDGSPYSAYDEIFRKIGDCDSSATTDSLTGDILGFSTMVAGTADHQVDIVRVGGYYWENGSTPTLNATDDWRAYSVVFEAPTY